MQEKIAAIHVWLGGRKALVVLVVLLLIFFSLSLIIQALEPKRSSSPEAKRIPQEQLAPSQQSGKPQLPTQAVSPPSVSFSSYDNKATLPTVPNQVNGYTLKANYSVDEVKEFGKKLGLTETKVPDDRFVILYSMTDMNSRGILTFDRVTGGILFQSYGIHKPSNLPLPTSSSSLSPPTSNFSPTIIASSFLTDLNLSDPTISCPITYQRKALTGVTFVECHRDWTLVGLPILNTIGVLNIPEEKSLSDVKLGTVDSSSPSDPSITSVSLSPQAEGKARPNDFNTITVGVTEDGRILSLESNLRKITETKQYSSSDILTPEEALNQFIAHKSQFSLTIPAGSGSVDWSKVYPGNKASGKKATITDYLLTYLENPGQAPQERLVPMYIIRGTAELSSGYTVRFMETVPALKNGLSSLSNQGDVAGEQTTYLAQGEDDRSLKLGRFEPTKINSPQTPTTTITFPTGPTITQSPKTPSTSTFQCTLPPGGKETTLTIPGIGQLTVVYGTSHLGTAGTHAFFFKSASFPISSIQKVRKEFLQVVEEQFVINVSKCLVENPTLMQSSITSVDDVYHLFTTLQASCSRARTIPLPPGQRAEGDPISTQLQSDISQKVAQRILTLFGTNQIAAWANRLDLFPQEVAIFDFISVASFSEGYAHTANCYISGISPMIYLYPEKETEVTVNLGGPVSYVFPSLGNHEWIVVAKPDGILRLRASSEPQPNSSGQALDLHRLYYEYDQSKVSFTEPNEGFVVKKDEWEGFIRNTLSPQLGLTQIEEDDLIVDVRNALTSPSRSPFGHLEGGQSQQGLLPDGGNYLQLSFVSREELEEKLPVSISPKPDTFHRIHLLLTPLNDTLSVPNPSLQKLSRDGFVAVELGASTHD